MDQLARSDEEQLITRSQQGDVTAFNQLVLHYQQTVYHTAFRLVGDPDQAADITQDAFLSALRAITSYRGGSSFRAWLMRIATNLVYDHWRRLQRHPNLSLESLEDDDDQYTPGPLNMLFITDHAVNPEERMLTLELQDLIQRGLRTLPPEQRTALVLCDVQGFSYEEVAQTTQTNMGTVRSRIARARARLRNYFLQHKELLPRDYRLVNNEET